MSDPQALTEAQPALVVTSSREVVSGTDVARLKQYGRYTSVLGVVFAIIVPILGRPGLLTWLTVGASVALVVNTFLTRNLITRPEHLRRGRLLLWSWPHGLVVPLLLPWFGFFSPALMSLSVGIYLFAMTSKRWVGVLAVGAALAGFVGGAVLTWLGVLPDVGVLPSSTFTGTQQLALGALVVVQLTLIQVMARTNYRETAKAFEDLEAALREVNRREALLAEARVDLAGALGPERRHGRWSGELAGPWKLGAVLGQGGMGEVYSARREDGAVAAVKLLTAAGGDAEVAHERFRREAAVLGGLKSKHVVQLLGVGELRPGIPWLAMELLQGKDLAAMLRTEKQIPIARVVELVKQLAEALEAARKLEVVHRDLKPQNVFFDEPSASWKVLDFGIARLESGGQTLTAGQAIGTPGYMSPEQVRGEKLDHRSDVFSLAALTYRALAGRPAFSPADPVRVFFDLLYRQPEAPGLSLDLECVLALGLAKKVEQRLETAVAFSESLELASRVELPEPRVRAGRAILAAHPWGTILEGHAPEQQPTR